MKTITLLLSFFFAFNMFANEMPNNDTYFLLKGRTDALDPVSQLVTNISRHTGIPLRTSMLADGEYFTFSYIENGQEKYTQRISISNPLVRDIRRHLKNGRTGESITKVCATQAGQFTNVITYGMNSYEISQPAYVGGDLSGVESSIAIIGSDLRDLKDGQAGLKADLRVINGNIEVIDGKLNVVDQKLDRNYEGIVYNSEQIDKANRRLNRNMWINIGGVLLGEVTKYVYHDIEMNQMKKQPVDIFNYSNNITDSYNNTTNHYNNGSDTTTTIPDPGWNTNGDPLNGGGNIQGNGPVSFFGNKNRN